MARYRLKIGGDPIDFTANSPTGFLDAWRTVSRCAPEDEAEWRKTAAALACDWCGQPVRYDTEEAFADDMIKNGMLFMLEH